MTVHRQTHAKYLAPWCNGYLYCTTSFIQSLNLGSGQVQILADNDPGWK